MKPRLALARITAGEQLAFDDMLGLMRSLLRGDIDDTLTAALLAALRTRGETVDDIAATAVAVREQMIEVPRAGALPHAVDLCGTGGDGAGTFNVSTAAAFVVCAAGAHVAKHGNRGVSSGCGSADVLQAFGVDITLSPEQVAQCIEQVGIGFMFTPSHHPALKRLAALRRSLGVRTVFNLTGPLCNPARVRCQLVGVFDARLAPALARAAEGLGAHRALVVHGHDGLDEITINGPTQVAELHGGQVHAYEIDPQTFGIPGADLSAVRATDAAASCGLLEKALSGAAGPARDLVLLNAAGALVACGIAPSLAEGLAQAAVAIDSGQAASRLHALVRFSRQFNH